MIMKKLIALLLALLMLSCTALGETILSEEAPHLTYEELEMYLNALADKALASGEVGNHETEEYGTSASFPGGVLKIADETLQKTTAILAASLTREEKCPRGLKIGDSLADVLSAYPNDNPALFGTYYDAALYIADEKPEAKAGWLLRDGQRVTEVVQAVYHWVEEGVIYCGVRYTLDQNVITHIEIFGMDNRMAEEEALAEINDVAAMQEMNEYFAYPVSEDGSTLAPFDREDLSFAGIDVLDLTVEMATEALGSAPVDEWLLDSTGDYLRLRQWDDLSILFLYNANKEFQQVDSITFTGDQVEGPRGVRLGDRMESVMYRFRHGEGGSSQNGIILYGDGQNAPYGVISYGEETASINYALALDEETSVQWKLTFVNGLLQTMTLQLR